MSSFTRKAIMDSCVRLLENRPVDKITVKDIVEDCGINRNTFYYHFADLPTLISEIMREDAQQLIHDNLEVASLWECLERILRFTQEHRRMALHLYHSNDRDIFEKQLFQICQYVVSQYVDRACGDLPVKEDDKRIIIEGYKCECFGQIINWMNTNMSEDCLKDMIRLCKLREGATKEMLLKSMKI
ncbi:MAG: TetR/AcrR family transcriptional regulator [Eubacteriales bacterium]|nr:TetR/AcrR family transcriptional regulator [Eubacteriales bacterium]